MGSTTTTVETYKIVSVHAPSMCFDLSYISGRVSLQECHDGDSQLWYWDGAQIRSKRHGHCLSTGGRWTWGWPRYEAVESVYAMPCNEWTRQDWHVDGQQRLRSGRNCIEHDFVGEPTLHRGCGDGDSHKWNFPI